MRILIHLILLLGVLTLASCGTTTVQTNVMHPAEVNMSGFEQVNILPFRGDPAGAEQIRQRLRSRMNQTGQFDVLHRDSMDQVMNEWRLSQSGITDRETRPDEASVLSAMVVINGDVMDHKYYEGRENKQVTQYDANGNPYVVNMQRTVGNARVVTSLEIVEVETMASVVVVTLTGQYTGYSEWFQDASPSLIPEPLMEQCYNQIVDQFMTKIAPTNEVVAVDFHNESKAPSTGMAIDYFSQGDYETAARFFEQAVTEIEGHPKAQPKEKARVYYNRGVCLEYCNRFEEAIASYRQAETASFKQEYVQARLRCEQRAREYQEAINQNLVPPR